MLWKPFKRKKTQTREVLEHVNRGFELFQRSQFYEAALVYQKGLAHDPNSVPLNAGLGFAYYYMKEYDIARKCFHRAVEADPGHWDAQRGYALSCLATNRVDEGRRILRKIRRKIFKDPSLIQEISFRLFQAQEFELALSYGEEALKLSPKNVDALLCVAGCLHFLDREETRKHTLLDEAMEISPSRPDLLDFYGNVLFDSGFRHKAMQVYERIAVCDLQNPVTLKRIILLYSEYGADPKVIFRYRDRLLKAEQMDSMDRLVDSIQKFVEEQS